MRNIEELQNQLTKGIGDFLLAVQTTRVVDVIAFRKIHQQAEGLAVLLKEHPLIPKSLLHELRTAIKVMRAEAPHIVSEHGTLVGMADKLEMTFDLILKGECGNDRIPGVPRII